MATGSEAAERPLRRDAERNRQRILDAAREQFAERGLRASHDDIARAAGVGVGTVYRRFPDREQLIDALFEARLEEMIVIAEEANAMSDPWTGLVHYLMRSEELQSADRGLKEIMLRADGGRARFDRARERILPLVTRLLETAQEAGVVRQDMTVTDLATLHVAAGAIADATRDASPDAWRRIMTIMVDGLRPSRRTTTPLEGEPLTIDEFSAALEATAQWPRHAAQRPKA